jgi:cytochrome o ubiquinol oxidase subunit 2
VIKFKRIFALLVITGATLLLAGCKHTFEVLQPRGLIASDERHLLLIVTVLMLVIVVPVIVAVFAIAYRYRASNKKAKYDPAFGHSYFLELIWWAVPCLIIAILGTVTWVSTHALSPYRPLTARAQFAHAKPITIEAIALRWKWLFIYPKQGIAMVNYVKFPVNVPVRFYVTSDAPMNSLQIQQLAGQIYAMNGMQTKLHLIANTIGNYRGRSVNFSGAGYNGMKFTAHVTNLADYNTWLASVKNGHDDLTLAEYHDLVKPTYNNKPKFYSSVDKGLFKKVMHSFMMPAHPSKHHAYKGVTL